MIKVFEPNLSIHDKFSVFKTMQKSFISGTSPVINEFEEALAEQFDRKYCTVLSNGSVALDLALKLFDFKKGDEVIVPSFTIISCLSAILRTKATPVFCDVDETSWNMTLEKVKKVATKNTKAIILVHLYGLTGEVDEIVNFCRENDIYIIEDAAESHGQIVGNKKCGSIGDVSTFSFYANKHITTGEGGAILTDSLNDYLELKKMINLDFDENKRFIHQNLYWNYRLSGLQAALGISQIKSLNKKINGKVKQGKYYYELLKDLNEHIQLPLNVYHNIQNHYWVYGIVLKNHKLKDEIIEFLKINNIETRPFFYPLHLQPALHAKFKNSANELKVSENLYKSGFYIPIGSHINKNIQKYISEIIHKFFN
jgi:perosamine synthetase